MERCPGTLTNNGGWGEVRPKSGNCHLAAHYGSKTDVEYLDVVPVPDYALLWHRLCNIRVRTPPFLTNRVTPGFDCIDHGLAVAYAELP